MAKTELNAPSGPRLTAVESKHLDQYRNGIDALEVKIGELQDEIVGCQTIKVEWQQNINNIFLKAKERHDAELKAWEDEKALADALQRQAQEL